MTVHGASIIDLSNAQSTEVQAVWLRPELCNLMQPETAAVGSRLSVAGLRMRLHQRRCNFSAGMLLRLARFGIEIERCSLGLTFASELASHQGMGYVSDLVKVKSTLAQPAWLCPELCGKLQLETATVVGRQQSTAALRMRLHLLSWTNGNFPTLTLFKLARFRLHLGVGRSKGHVFGLVFQISRPTWHELPTVCAEETRKGGGEMWKGQG